MIPFHRRARVGTELAFIQEALDGDGLSGGGSLNRRCEAWLEHELGCHRALLTPSCTAALEMAALLLGVEPGDEVIMPSFTFPSTANAFALRGARIVFVDVRPDTLNLDENLLEAALTPRTRGVVPVHYAGVGCDMRSILDFAQRHGLWVIEDAAQGLLSEREGQALGTLGDVGCLSFHETKGVTAGGEGGALLINRPDLLERAEIIQEKGTDRARFRRGEVPEYSWQEMGSSHLMSEVQAAFLLAHLEAARHMTERRLDLWNGYAEALSESSLGLPVVPPGEQHNAHIFALRAPSVPARSGLIRALLAEGVMTTSHYVPLHSSPAGKRFGRFSGADRVTTEASRRLLRLPLFYNLTDQEHRTVIDAVLRHSC
ncbi:dTDP-4-amino-4,6-dideoxygalactose transaminase [Kineosporia babensis]|uniref:dTDP-4-amino-4,6-dideoxygalactose transaminase n=1 Tax=Kineosporia babensis TaxID=499548 RepID=A0A9X1NBE8_9ACTN|nr:dTDP-4-amino-4,6-dideoxygalactose transaminase [Kineosporia babensis]MCD5310620.1 dTDP-4-amino-4,6-dideoxygalactose transaminase [Kineosporia babensis]